MKIGLPFYSNEALYILTDFVRWFNRTLASSEYKKLKVMLRAGSDPDGRLCIVFHSINPFVVDKDIHFEPHDPKFQQVITKAIQKFMDDVYLSELGKEANIRLMRDYGLTFCQEDLINFREWAADGDLYSVRRGLLSDEFIGFPFDPIKTEIIRKTVHETGEKMKRAAAFFSNTGLVCTFKSNRADVSKIHREISGFIKNLSGRPDESFFHGLDDKMISEIYYWC